MAKRNSKKRGKAAKKPRKTMKMAAKKTAKAHKKAGKHAARSATMAAHKRAHKSAIMIPIKAHKAKPADPVNPLGITIPAVPFGYSRDSVMNALVVMLILFALIGAGVFYPQVTAPPQALPVAPGTMQNK